MSSGSSPQGRRLVEQVARACATAQAPLALLERVAALVRARIPYDVAGWLLVDPDTMLLTGVYSEDVPREAHLALIECELTEDDVTKFVDLARCEVPAAALSAATGGDLARSTRWSRIYAPAGYGDELRAVFRSGSTCWGHGCLTRLAGEPFFTPEEVDLMARLAPHVGHGIRTGLLLTEQVDDTDEGPGMVVLADDGSVESMTPQARAWLGPLEDERLSSTIVLHEVAAQARVLAEEGGGPPARARTRSPSGEWVVVRGARLEPTSGGDGRTAVLVEPASRSDIAPLLVHLRRLTSREQQVTQLLLTGMATRDIARQLWITPETLRGHVKSVFAKLGVSSRPELAAQLSREPVVHQHGGAS
ncbi:helix-turn-helix transcriptional regulator [Ornithinimicrobium sediminis]|uniref:helix-turn-helix transcriptional regulator n=1 Tax=Ornithinimicrobium sediminis TaxID=2904603 RepID=UPI001E5400A8|nr:helix-turn-helix transcriptional regulator [Ornithinimicrobium sediminis]MCE0488332.1 helix-turn-helix transcriptional regulator [Ornithinimicrobium sediminis]